jgi:hypothetical protein
MPEIPVAGFLLQALGAAALALMLTSFERRRPRFGVREWSRGLWFLAAALLASLAVSRVPEPTLRTPMLALAGSRVPSPGLVLLGTWSRWNDRSVPRAAMAARLLGVLGLATRLPLLGRAGARSCAQAPAPLDHGAHLAQASFARPGARATFGQRCSGSPPARAEGRSLPGERQPMRNAERVQ